jgi:chromosome segregation ATPase
MAIFASIVSFFSIKKYVKETREENQKLIDAKIDSGVERVIDHFNSKSEIINQKLHTTDTVLSRNTNEIENIQDDIKVLEKDFKSLCQTIGKHEYIVDKVFPEYVDLRNSIQTFKSKVNENLVTNNEHVQRNDEDDKNQK